jgi:hypothetical protein
MPPRPGDARALPKRGSPVNGEPAMEAITVSSMEVEPGIKLVVIEILALATRKERLDL